MTTLEKLIKETWEAGFQAAMDRIDAGMLDVPEEYFFEKHIEQVIDSLQSHGEKRIPAPVIDWVGTNAPDPRDAYTTRINGHTVGIHGSEEAARNHAWALEAYLGMHDDHATIAKARGETE